MVDRINLILKAKNITARQFAEEIGIQPSGMSHILSGRNNPSLDFVMKVIRRFPEIDINWLMFGKGEMYESSYISRNNVKQESVQETAVNKNTRDIFENGKNEESISNSSVKNIQAQAVPDLFSTLDEKSEKSDSKDFVKDNNVVRSDVNTQTDNFFSKKTAVSNRILSTDNDDIREKKNENAELNENRMNDLRQGTAPVDENLGRKRIMKVVILYDDHSFSEYYPE